MIFIGLASGIIFRCFLTASRCPHGVHLANIKHLNCLISSMCKEKVVYSIIEMRVVALMTLFDQLIVEVIDEYVDKRLVIHWSTVSGFRFEFRSRLCPIHGRNPIGGYVSLYITRGIQGGTHGVLTMQMMSRLILGSVRKIWDGSGKKAVWIWGSFLEISMSTTGLRLRQ